MSTYGLALTVPPRLVPPRLVPVRLVAMRPSSLCQPVIRQHCRDYIGMASYTSTVPPPARTGQPLANTAASSSESAVTIE
jgi:hypothetical protein